MSTTQAPPKTTAVTAPGPKPPRDVQALLKSESFKSAVGLSLPKHLNPDRFCRVALTALLRQPELMQCSQESLWRCMMDLSAYGLEPDGRRAHLIPFRDNKTCVCGHPVDQHKGLRCTMCECEARRPRLDVQLIIDYKGLVELVRRSGEVSYIHADVVYSADKFSYSFGTTAHLEHVPSLDREHGKPMCAYSFVKLKDGADDFQVMSLDEIQKVRMGSKARDSGPWTDHFDEMAKKTVFRRHTKWLPLSPSLREAVERDDDVTGADTDIVASLGRSIERASIDPRQLSASADVNRGHDDALGSEPEPEAKAGDGGSPGAPAALPTYASFGDAPDPLTLANAGTKPLILVAGQKYQGTAMNTWEEVKA